MGNLQSQHNDAIITKLKELLKIIEAMFYDKPQSFFKEYKRWGHQMLGYVHNIKLSYMNLLISQIMQYTNKDLHLFMMESLLFFAKHPHYVNAKMDIFLEKDVPILPNYPYFRCIEKNDNAIQELIMVSLINSSKSCPFPYKNPENQILYIKDEIKGIYIGFLPNQDYHQAILIMPQIKFQFVKRMKSKSIYNMITSQTYLEQILEKFQMLKSMMNVMYLEDPHQYSETTNILNDIVFEIEHYAIHLEIVWIDMFISQVTQYRNPNIVIFMLLSLLFIAKNPKYVTSIQDYTGSFYTIVNPFLDFYLNPNDSRYLDDSQFDQYMNQDEKQKLLKLIGMFDELDLPVLPLEQFYRCVKVTENFDFTKIESINYRVSSVSLYAPNNDLLKRDNCPIQGDINRLDQVLTNVDPNLKGLFIGFLSNYPFEHEVLLGPRLLFKITKDDRIAKKQFCDISQM